MAVFLYNLMKEGQEEENQERLETLPSDSDKFKKQKKGKPSDKCMCCIPLTCGMRLLSLLMISEVVFQIYMLVIPSIKTASTVDDLQSKDNSLLISVSCTILKMLSAIIMTMFAFSKTDVSGRKCCVVACYLQIVAQVGLLAILPLTVEEPDWTEPCAVTGAYVIMFLYFAHVSKRFSRMGLKAKVNMGISRGMNKLFEPKKKKWQTTSQGNI